MTGCGDIETLAGGGIAVLTRRRGRRGTVIIASATGVETDIEILVVIITVVAHFGYSKGKGALFAFNE